MSPTTTTSRRPTTRDPRGRAADRESSIAAERRRRQRRMRRLRQLLVVVLVLAVVLGAAWLVWFSSVLATEKVAISGTKLLTVDGVRSVAAVPMGLPLARQDTGAIADRVATLAPVDTVTVDRSWPNTVVVKVTERVPVIAVRTGAGFELVDHTGKAFENVPDLPDGLVVANVDPGNAALLVEAGTIATEVPNELRSQIATIAGTSTDSFTVRLNSGLVVTWGSADQSALKGQVTLLLLDKKPKAIDVSAPHSPALR